MSADFGFIFVASGSFQIPALTITSEALQFSPYCDRADDFVNDHAQNYGLRYFDILIDLAGDRYEVSVIESDVKAYLCDEIDGPEMRRKQAILEKSFPEEEIPADLHEIIDQPERCPIRLSIIVG